MQPTRPIQRRYRGASAEQRREERRARLVDAGLDVFGTTGYHSATVDAICAEAGLTKRYFYESFGSSEELLLAAYEVATARLRDAVVQAVTSAAQDTAVPDIGAITTAGLRALFTALHDDRRVGQLLFVEVLGVSPAVNRAYQGSMETWAWVLAGLVAARHTDDGVRLDLLASGIVGAIIGLVLRWIIADYADPVEDLVAAARALIEGAVTAAAD